MTQYVVWNIDEKKYVAERGMESSYTNKLQNARVFQSKEAAQADCCGNERVIER